MTLAVSVVKPGSLTLCLRWKNGILEEIMEAEYVISEVNGLITYSYSLTAATANCRSQPQNWSTFESDIEIEQPILWNREVGRCSLSPGIHEAPAPLKLCAGFYQSSIISLWCWRLEDPLQSKFEASLGFTKVSQIR